MEARKVFWKKVDTIPGTPWTISGYSRSAYRTGFYIKELDLMLDAGPQLFKKPKKIYITHTHSDHTAELPYTTIGDAEGDHVFEICIPEKAIPFMKAKINSSFSCNAMENISLDSSFDYKGLSGTGTFRTVMNKNQVEVFHFDCDHPIPTVSYGFSIVAPKLKEKYKSLPGKEIGKLRKEGVEITHDVVQKKMAYVCDTSIKTLERVPQILEYPIIFIECTFLMDGEESAAEDKQHIHWNQLEPYVKTYKDNIFYLFHFSLKYKDEEIQEYMENIFKEKDISNVKLWLPDIV